MLFFCQIEILLILNRKFFNFGIIVLKISFARSTSFCDNAIPARKFDHIFDKFYNSQKFRKQLLELNL